MRLPSVGRRGAGGRVRVQPVLDFTGWHPIHDGLSELLAPNLDALDLASAADSPHASRGR